MADSDDLDTTLELFLLVVLALFFAIFGISLFGIQGGALSYNPDATYGLLLFLAGVQAIALGKTPFGDFQRSPLIVAAGFLIVAFGLLGCFVPGITYTALRNTTGILMAVGAPILMIITWTGQNKARFWWRAGGNVRHLALASTEVYLLMFLLGLVTLVPTLATNAAVSVLTLLMSLALFHLVWAMFWISRNYPQQWQTRNSQLLGAGATAPLLRRSCLGFPIAVLALFGLILTMVGGLLLLVGRGVLPFSPDGQFAVVLTVMAIQIGCLGETPIGTFRRNWLIKVTALLCAGLGIASAITPGGIPALVPIVLAALSVGGGAMMLWGAFSAKMADLRNPGAELGPIRNKLRYLWFNLVLQALMVILFGLATFFPTILSLSVTAIILLAYGLLMFDLTRAAYSLGKLSPA